jgi:hypothetical protein
MSNIPGIDLEGVVSEGVQAEVHTVPVARGPARVYSVFKVQVWSGASLPVQATVCTWSRFHLLSGSQRICPLARLVGPPFEWGST